MGHLGNPLEGEMSVKQGVPMKTMALRPAGHGPGNPLSTGNLPSSVADSCILGEKELLRYKQVFLARQL